ALLSELLEGRLLQSEVAVDRLHLTGGEGAVEIAEGLLGDEAAVRREAVSGPQAGGSDRGALVVLPKELVEEGHLVHVVEDAFFEDEVEGGLLPLLVVTH